MSSGTFTDIFGGGSILPSWPAYVSIALAGTIQLGWPTEINSGNGEVVAEIIEVTATAPNPVLQLSNASEIGIGYSFLINNIGATTFTVEDSMGNTIASISSGTVWQLYCYDNTTVQGSWRIFQYGAGVSSANAAALAGYGLVAMGATLNENVLINAQVVNYAVQVTDRASLIEWTGNGTGTITLPNPGTVGSGWFCYVRNSGPAAITVNTAAGTLNGSASLTFNSNDSSIIISDGNNFWTIGYGQSLSSAFTFVTINLAGVSGTYTLAGSNLGKIAYKLTGALAGDVTFVVPASVAQFWINNQTSGGSPAYTMTVSSSGSGGATYALAQGNANILYCDGLNIVAAVTLSSGTPTFPDGSAAAPSITFASDATLGLFKAGADTLGFASSGKLRATVNAAGDWVFGTADSGTTVTINGVADTNAFEVISGNTAGQALADFLLERAGSTINQFAQGPSFELLDTTNNNGVVIQTSGGQIEIWEQYNNGAWFQAAFFDHLGNLTLNQGLTVTGNLSVGGNLTVTGTCTATGGFNT